MIEQGLQLFSDFRVGALLMPGAARLHGTRSRSRATRQLDKVI